MARQQIEGLIVCHPWPQKPLAVSLWQVRISLHAHGAISVPNMSVSFTRDCEVLARRHRAEHYWT